MNLTVEEGWSGPARVGLQTVGCKLNQAETEWLARRFLEAGCQVVAPDHTADIYLLNTCTVTRTADRKCRNLLRLARRRNPHALIVVTGCYAERAPGEIDEIEGAGLVIGNPEKERLVDIIKAKAGGHVGGRQSNAAQSVPLRTRALVKIQEGCSQPCSFCIVPHVRGRERSQPAEDIIAQIRTRVFEGYREVVLTGTRIGSYSGPGGLPGLIKRILKETNVARLRLSSLEPCDLTDDLLQLWADSRLCRHIHLPLQSGSDPVLERMGRAYSTSDYMRAVSLARAAIPDLALTTDIMVGFPGESEEEFSESFRFCECTGFAGLHVFPYSARPRTKAAQMENKVDDKEKKHRSRVMLDLARSSSLSFRQKFVGKCMHVLWEGNKDGIWFGLTDNYLRVFFPGHRQLANQLLATNLTALRDGGLRGELITQ